MIKKIIKAYLIVFIVGAIIFGSIGVVVATTIASSSVNYTTTTNNKVETVEDALDDLYNQIIGRTITCYNGTCGKLSYRYWNNNFAGSSGANVFNSTHMPTITYATRALLEQNYVASNFTNNPMYIRSVLIDGNVVGHQTCLWNNNKEFCLEPNYWVGDSQDEIDGSTTGEKLKADMEAALGVTIASNHCTSHSDYTNCVLGDFYCYADSNGDAYCRSNVTNLRCRVFSIGHARCGN